MDATGCQICWQACNHQHNVLRTPPRTLPCGHTFCFGWTREHAACMCASIEGLCLPQLPGLDAFKECPACRQCLAATNPQSFSFNYALEAMMDWLRDCHIAKTTISHLDPSSLRTQFSVGLAQTCDGCRQKTFVSMNTVLQVPCRSFKSRCNSQTGLLVWQEWPHQVRELLA